MRMLGLIRQCKYLTAVIEWSNSGSAMGKTYYINASTGDDERGDGSEEKPLKSLFRAMLLAESSDGDFRVAAEGDDKKGSWEPASKSAIKKNKTRFDAELRKKQKRVEKEANEEAKEEDQLEEAKKITLSLDPSLPEAKSVKIRECKEAIGKRVKIYGHVHRLRQQGGVIPYE